jgi:hypothetical protein
MPPNSTARLPAIAFLLLAAGYIAFRYWGVPGTIVLALATAVSAWTLGRLTRP